MLAFIFEKVRYFLVNKEAAAFAICFDAFKLENLLFILGFYCIKGKLKEKSAFKELFE